VANPNAAPGEPGMLSVETGEFLQNEQDVGDIVVGVSNGRPIYLREVARVEAGAQLPKRYVWFTPGAADPAQPRPARPALPGRHHHRDQEAG
jgi:multidrug efflux pump subunit AcrB